MQDDPHPEIANPTKVTHFLCPEGAVEGVPSVAHYLIFPDLNAPEPSVSLVRQDPR